MSKSARGNSGFFLRVIMKYPIQAKGHISADGEPLQLLPPSELVKRAATLLDPGSKVLDVGAYNGTNGFYLAEQGHRVDSIEINPLYIYDASILAQVIGRAATGNRFIQADLRNYQPKIGYDAAIATKVLPYMSLPDAHQGIDKLQMVTKADGLNVVSVYLGNEQEQAEVATITLFSSGELEELYKRAGWQIVTYEERMKPLRRVLNPQTGGREIRVGSYADMIARKKSPPTLKQSYLSQAAAIEKTQPEQARHLRQLAANMDGS